MALLPRFENACMNLRPMKWLTKFNTGNAMATVAVVSNVSKDAVNCVYYVKQSLENEKIPDDKRTFVAGLDLANGILNVITQTVTGFGVIGFFSDKIFNKFVAKQYSNSVVQKILSSGNNGNGLRNVTQDTVKELLDTKCGIAKNGLKVITALVATQIFCKRVLVPLIATPMASHFKKKFEEKHGQNASTLVPAQKDTVTFENSSKQAENVPKCFNAFTK